MSAVMELRPTVGTDGAGTFTVYIGASYRELTRDQAFRLFVELGEALSVPTVARAHFFAWAAGLRHLPTTEQVMEKFNVSRATACRWLAFERAQREEKTA